MNGRAIVELRGRDEEVRYIDHGYDPETGTHRIDWYLAQPAGHNVNLTGREAQAVYEQLVQISRQGAS